MWATIITVVLQLVGWFLERSKASKQQKQAYLEWIKKAASDMGSVKLHKWGEEQLAELKSKPWKET